MSAAQGAIPAAALFGALLVGADKMQRAVQVPSALAITLQGLVVLFVVSSDLYVRRRSRRRVGSDAQDMPAPEDEENAIEEPTAVTQEDANSAPAQDGREENA